MDEYVLSQEEGDGQDEEEALSEGEAAGACARCGATEAREWHRSYTTGTLPELAPLLACARLSRALASLAPPPPSACPPPVSLAAAARALPPWPRPDAQRSGCAAAA